MKAVRFYEKHKLVYENVEEPKVGGFDVKVRIRYCGICGTDVHIYEGEDGSAEVNPPTILGHEFSGDVVEIGEGITTVKVGDRVSVDPNDYCGCCYHCANGNRHLCNKMKGLGTNLDGGFAEYIVIKEHLVHKYSDKLTYKQASMIEPVSCCIHGAKLTNIGIADTVMVVGTGNIGLIMVQLAKHMGASKIIAVEPSLEKRMKAKEFGAGVLIDPLNDDTIKILKEHNIENIDKVIDCAGRVNTAEYAIEHAGKGATVMLFGLTGPHDTISVKPFRMFEKELTIKASFVNPNAFKKAISLLENGIIKVDDIITDIIPLEETHRVFEEKLYSKAGKVLIEVTKAL